MKRRAVLGGGIGVLATLAASRMARGEVFSLNDAINKAGRQRMLSQRLAKAYLQIGINVDVERSRRVLDQSLALFDRQLVELKAFAPSPEVRATFLEKERLWLAYKEMLVGSTPSPEGARKLLPASEEVLKLAHGATVLLEKTAASATGRLVNLAGRQRMLSQRMAKFYQAGTWGVAPPNATAEIGTARREFVVALAELASSPRNTPEIRSELELVDVQWIFFDNALRAAGGAASRVQNATNVATASERILEVMDRVTGMYDKLA